MAQTGNSTRRSFYEVVFRGKPKVVRAFLGGLVMGSGHDARLFFSYLSGVHHEGKVEKFAELVGFRADDCHVIVDQQTSRLIKKLARRITEETGLAITSHRGVRAAEMPFSFQAFAANYDQQIVDRLRNLPTGLRLQGFKHDVRLSPDAKGVEAYSPVHDYEATGQGVIKGPIDALIDLKEDLKDFPLIKTEEIKLSLA